MDNENQVDRNHQIEEGKRAFLHERLVDQVSQAKIYSLEDEFAKTKKNRSIKVYLFLLLLIALIGAGTFFLAKVVEDEAQTMDLQLAEFTDMNLIEVLNQAQTAEQKLKGLNLELEQLLEQKETEINMLKEQAELDKELVISEDLTASERTGKINAIDTQLEQDIADVEADYEERITALEEEIAAVEQEVADAQLQALDVAERQQAIQNNYQQLYDLQLAEMEDQYEDMLDDLEAEYEAKEAALQKYYNNLRDNLILKYNPKFTLSEVISEDSGTADEAEAIMALYYYDYMSNDSTLNDYDTVLKTENIISKSEFTTFRSVIAYQTAIIDRLQATSYTNSIPQTLNYLGYFTEGIIDEYERIWTEMADVIEFKNKWLDHYFYALSYYSDENRDSGQVLDTRDLDNMIVYIQDVYTIGDTGKGAMVFRGNDEYIGKIRVYPIEGGHRAEVVELTEGKTIQPLDKILLNLKEE